MASNTMKLLVPLATACVAGAIAVGSGASWTSESTMHASVGSGKILHANDHDGMTIAVTKLKPGRVETGQFKISEDDSNTLDATLRLEASNLSQSMTPGALLIRIAGNGQSTGFVNFETLDDAAISLGTLDDGFDEVTYTITIKMSEDAGPENMAKTAAADLKIIGETTDGDESSGDTVTFATAPATPAGE